MTTNAASILDSIKKVLGFDSEYTAFDVDLIMHINTVFGSLTQLNVGPPSGFAIADNTLLWSDYTTNIVLLAAIKSYMFTKVRLLFDVPATSFAIEAMEKQSAELEWRIQVMAEQIDPPSDPSGETGSDSGAIVQPYWWDLTGLSDFPDEAIVGDLGIDMSTGDVWRKAA